MVRRGITALAALIVASGILFTSPADASSFVVTIHTDASGGDVGGTFAFTGTVSPNEHGQPVALQRYASSSWHTVATSRLNAASRYQIGWHADVHGSLVFRVAYGYIPSPHINIYVFRWHYLSDLPLAASDCTNPKPCGAKAGLTITNTTYHHSWFEHSPYGGGDSWNLHQSCTTLRADIGLEVGARADASALLGESADGTIVHYALYTPGVDRYVSLALNGKQRVMLWRSPYGGSAYAGWGNPRIRCLW
jgi:hypothetical protein